MGAGAKTRLRTPKAVTYHEQPHYCRFIIGHSLSYHALSYHRYCRFMIGRSLRRTESRTKEVYAGHATLHSYSQATSPSWSARFHEIQDLYYAAAQMSPEELDPDVQIGLGVLYNIKRVRARLCHINQLL